MINLPLTDHPVYRITISDSLPINVGNLEVRVVHFIGNEILYLKKHGSLYWLIAKVMQLSHITLFCITEHFRGFYSTAVGCTTVQPIIMICFVWVEICSTFCVPLPTSSFHKQSPPHCLSTLEGYHSLDDCQCHGGRRKHRIFCAMQSRTILQNLFHKLVIKKHLLVNTIVKLPVKVVTTCYHFLLRPSFPATHWWSWRLGARNLHQSILKKTMLL